MFNKNLFAQLVFFTINLYYFILFILNHFLKKLKIPTEGFTDGMYHQ